MNQMPEILFEDNHLIAVNKRVSDLVQGDKSGDLSLDKILKQYIREKYNKPGEVFLGVPHRIDRPVSGVVLFTRTGKALTRMNELFKTRDTRKIYWAVVKDLPESVQGTLVHYLRRNERQNKSYSSLKEVPGSKAASLSYQVIAHSNNYHLLEIELHTGRHHQIRAQLAAIGCPIKGDLKYGAARSNPDGGISLHARELSFVHPVRKEMVRIIAAPPENDIFGHFKLPV
jgi:23S rRNA pseudouridine1911/1915/1917 synthase